MRTGGASAVPGPACEAQKAQKMAHGEQWENGTTRTIDWLKDVGVFKHLCFHRFWNVWDVMIENSSLVESMLDSS